MNYLTVISFNGYVASIAEIGFVVPFQFDHFRVVQTYVMTGGFNLDRVRHRRG